MAEKQCNLLKNGGGMETASITGCNLTKIGKIVIAQSNAWTPANSVIPVGFRPKNSMFANGIAQDGNAADFICIYANGTMNCSLKPTSAFILSAVWVTD